MQGIPDEIANYYSEKHRDLPRGIDPAAKQLRELDNLISASLYGWHEVSGEQIENAIQAVINAPGSTWKEEVIRYRIRVVHYS